MLSRRVLPFIVLFFLMCGDKTTDLDQTLICGIQSDPVSLDPAEATEDISARILCNLYDPLVKFKEGSTQIEPALARTWEVTGNGKRWTFHLRKGVAFHDGTPFDAEAVKISFDRQINPESPYYSEDPPNVFRDSAFNGISEIRVVDRSTVQFALKHPLAPMLRTLAMFYGSSIVSPAAVKKYGRAFGRHPVGAGPFRLKSWEQGKGVVLERNEAYWGGAPKLKEVLYKIIPESSDMVNALLKGSIDVISEISPTYLERLYFNPSVNILTGEGISIFMLGFNCQKPPYTDEKIRKAVAAAIDKKRIVNSLSRGKGGVADSPLPPNILGHDETIRQISYDPRRAKALLREADHPDGFKTKLFYFQPSPSRAGVFPLTIQSYLSKVGIDVEIVYFDSWDSYNEAITSGEGELFADGWLGDNGDPDSFLYFLFHSQAMGDSGNLFNYHNARVDALLEEARQCMEESNRLRFYREAQEIIVRESPCVFLSYTGRMYAVRRRVQQFTVSPFRTERLENVFIQEPSDSI
jgi:peptide/nickel transport system substrate-binding protein